jgi:hypothetical protein
LHPPPFCCQLTTVFTSRVPPGPATQSTFMGGRLITLTPSVFRISPQESPSALKYGPDPLVRSPGAGATFCARSGVSIPWKQVPAGFSASPPSSAMNVPTLKRVLAFVFWICTWKATVAVSPGPEHPLMTFNALSEVTATSFASQPTLPAQL